MEQDWLPNDLHRAFETEGTTAYCVLPHPDWRVERFGADILASCKWAPPWEIVPEILSRMEAAEVAVERIFVRDLPRNPSERDAPQQTYGNTDLPPEGWAVEAGLRYHLDFLAGYSAGFFLDQRANRARVKSLAPKSLLNCFSYTCSFSVVAATTGAATTSVDLSKKSLMRGAGNFDANAIPREGQTFIADDVLEVLPRLARRGEKFGVIILDPPTFSRGAKGRPFQVERDMATLFQLSLELAAPKASILLSTNCTALRTKELEVLARQELKHARKGASIQWGARLDDLPTDQAARTLWVDLK